ncbi:uroporphyrinogen-III C-methyltransferase [Aliikangiella coralliicola]|uniref:Heme biosynthesis operon protein HemX n=1 Tax=Aliikangiella coralliicola TaxID=2592383 RepID=A0A545UG09_9GAMM|nr:uroporphyrinogen-III C-methyltransferase [Aliikangiella coralliicola]TQV88407.1 hypothetical protein FLL46_07750 [Aliikangiella coralliicola]
MSDENKGNQDSSAESGAKPGKKSGTSTRQPKDKQGGKKVEKDRQSNASEEKSPEITKIDASAQADLSKTPHSSESPQSAETEKTTEAQKTLNEEAPSETQNYIADNLTESKSNTPQADLFTQKKAPKLSTTRRARNTKTPLLIISIILIILALGGVGWSGYSQYQMKQSWQELQNQLQQQASQQAELGRTTQQTAQTSLQTADSNQRIINQQTQLVQQLRQALTATQQRVRELSGRQKQDWLLAEAEYLIKLAQFKISLEKDKTTAIGLLKTADNRVLATADNSLIELRQAIAQDIANLQLIVAPDVGGISSQLKAVANQIPALDLKALEFQPEVKQEQPEESEPETFEWSQVYRDFLDDFVTIKDHSEPVKPLMTPEQRANLNANIQLSLQQAQIALIRGEQQLYQNSLADASKWIDDFFIQNETSAAVEENLAFLQQVNVNIDLPAELTAKKAIQAINQQRLYQWLEAPDTSLSQPDIIQPDTSQPDSPETESQP